MISKYSHKELTWIDLEASSEEEILYIIEQYSIPLSIEDEIRTKNVESKTKLNNGYIFTSLYFPQISIKENEVLNNKLIFIINNNFILTIHENPIEALSEFLKNLEIDTTLPEQLQIKHTDLLSYYLIKNLYLNLKEKLLLNNIEINKIEDSIITKKNNDLSISIYKKNQTLINTEQTLGSHKKVLELMSKYLIQIFGDKFESYSSIITEEFYEINQIINAQIKNINNLALINNSNLINKSAKKYKLSILISVITLILVISTFIYVISNI
jgi:magnesium transporter